MRESRDHNGRKSDKNRQGKRRPLLHFGRFLTTRSRGWKQLVSILACLVVFVTTYALILPAVTLEKENTEAVGMVIDNDAAFEAAETSFAEVSETTASEDFDFSASEEIYTLSTDASAVAEVEPASEEDDPFTTEEGDIAGDSQDAVTDFDTESESGITVFTSGKLSCETDAYIAYVSFGADAEVPENTVFTLTQLDEAAYTEHLEKVNTVISDSFEEIGEIEDGLFYKAAFTHEGEEIFPTAPVDIKIEYKETFRPHAEGAVLAVLFSVTDAEDILMKEKNADDTDLAVVSEDNITVLELKDCSLDPEHAAVGVTVLRDAEDLSAILEDKTTEEVSTEETSESIADKEQTETIKGEEDSENKDGEASEDDVADAENKNGETAENDTEDSTTDGQNEDTEDLAMNENFENTTEGEVVENKDEIDALTNEEANGETKEDAENENAKDTVSGEDAESKVEDDKDAVTDEDAENEGDQDAVTDEDAENEDDKDAVTDEDVENEDDQDKVPDEENENKGDEDEVADEDAVKDENTENEDAEEEAETYVSDTISVRGDDYTVILSYTEEAKIPEGATASVRELIPDTEEYTQHLIAAKAAMDLDESAVLPAEQARFFDITIWDADGIKEREPKGPVTVQIIYDDPIPVPDTEQMSALHFTNDEPLPVILELQDIQTEEQDETAVTAVTFDSNSFSVFGIVYTVDFSFGEYEYHLEGEGSITLSELFTLLEIDENIADVTDAIFSNEELVSVTQIENDWLLTSLQPFTTAETLKVIFADGHEIIIWVTDDMVVSNVEEFKNAFKNNETVKLNNDLDLSQSGDFTAIEFSEGTYTLDLNGHTIKLGNTNLFKVHNTATLTIQNSVFSQDASEQINDGVSYNRPAIYSYDSGKGKLEYYVTVPTVNNIGTGETSETVYRHTVETSGLILGSSDDQNALPVFYMDGGTLNLNGGMIAGSQMRAIKMNGGTLNLNGGYICGNHSKSRTIQTEPATVEDKGNGGAILADLTAHINLNGTILAANTTDGNGGAIALSGNALLQIIGENGSIISGNRCLNGNGWGDKNTVHNGGGGIFASGNAAIIMSDGYITNNYAQPADYFDGGGGVLLTEGSTFTMNGGYITGNYAISGGGGLHTAFQMGASFTMSGGFISANRAENSEGGGVTIDQGGTGRIISAENSRCYITNNSTGTTVHWGGGGLFCADGGTLIVQDVVVENNAAGGFGGGVAGCSTGRVIEFPEKGGAIFDNRADGIHTSGNGTSKTEDQTLAAQSQVFRDSGYQDYFCALYTIIHGSMLGGGAENWSGSADGSPVTVGKDDVLVASSVAGLTAAPNDADKRNAKFVAKVFINGNQSYTHGGGILCNGYLVIGNSDKPYKIGSRLELSGTKELLGSEDLKNKQFSFTLRDEQGNIAAIGYNDESGAINFDRQLAFSDKGTYVYYLNEDATSDASILNDSTEYKISVTISEDTENGGEIAGVKKIEYYISSVKIEEKSIDDPSWKLISDTGDMAFDPYFEAHAFKKAITEDVTFTNYKLTETSVKVNKIWTDGNGKHEEDSITVHLDQKEGNCTSTRDTVHLNSENNWSYQWNNLPVRNQNTGEMISYEIREDGVNQYVTSYDYLNSASRKGYWVPLQENDELKMGEKYVIASQDNTKVLNISGEHYGDNKNETVGQRDYAGTSSIVNESIEINGTTYGGYYPETAFQPSSIFQPDRYGNNLILRCSAYPLMWIGNESNGSENANFKTTWNGAADCAQYACEVKWEGGELKLRRGHLSDTGNCWDTVGFNDGSFVLNSNKASVYKLIFSDTEGETTVTITNRPVKDIKFKLDLTKKAQNPVAITENDSEGTLKDTRKVLPGAVFQFYQAKLKEGAETGINDISVYEKQGPPIYVTGSNGNYRMISAASDTENQNNLTTNLSGKIILTDIPGGTYILTEIKAPEGYGKVEDQLIVLDEHTPDSTLNLVLEDPIVTYELPSTGGPGAEIYRLIGSILFLSAGIFLLTKRASLKN